MVLHELGVDHYTPIAFCTVTHSRNVGLDRWQALSNIHDGLLHCNWSSCTSEVHWLDEWSEGVQFSSKYELSTLELLSPKVWSHVLGWISSLSSVTIDCLCNLGLFDCCDLLTWPCSLTCISAADGLRICSVVSVVSVGSGVLEGGSGCSKNQYR